MSELEDIVKPWNQFHRIVVTGPQRSGTKIASKVIADILNWLYVDEDRFVRNGVKGHDTNYFKWMNDPTRQTTVLHCPRISHACHLTPKPTLVVFMIRNVDDIIASDKHRIAKYKQSAWAGSHRFGTPVQSVFTAKARQYSKLFYNNKKLDKYEVPQAVYDVWNNTQKQFDFNYYELDYNLLKQNRLWLPLGTRRKQFTSGTQTCLS